MNAHAPIATDKNMEVWNALCRTDPKHTKQFKRAGGFSGTALKPIWIVKRLTEQFGPVGKGWGINEPTFQVVNGDNREVLVFCTVSCWWNDETTGQPCFTHGVGGDKIVSYIKANPQYNRPERWENDDEAFKKALTDAVGNAFKFLGVGADIHMGQFEDSKYVQEVAREFAAEAAGGQREERKVSPRQSKHSALRTAYKQFVHELNGCGDGSELSAFLATADSVKLVAEIKDKLPHIWDGEDWPEGTERPDEWEPLADIITRRQKECAAVTASYAGV